MAASQLLEDKPVRFWHDQLFYKPAKKGGVVFIPAYLVEDVVLNAEFISLKDAFGHQRLREQKYTPGQIDTQWTEEIKKDFLKWLDDNPGKLPMTRQELDQFMKDRTW